MTREQPAAAQYAERGWRVFPLCGKVPLTAHGFRDATADVDQVRAWWREHPTAGIGWAVAAGHFVLDVDARHRGHESLHALEREHGRLAPTLSQITGGGGLHLIYRVPAGAEVRQLAGLREGIDTRASGKGYVVLPPSLHPSGLRYAWKDRVQPAEAPAWLVALVRVPRPTTAHKPSPVNGIADRYALAALVGEAREVAATVEGARNDRLFRAWKRCSVDLADVLPRAVVVTELTAAARAAGLADREIATVLR